MPIVHSWVRPMYTCRAHGCSVHTTREHGPS